MPCKSHLFKQKRERPFIWLSKKDGAKLIEGELRCERHLLKISNNEVMGLGYICDVGRSNRSQMPEEQIVAILWGLNSLFEICLLLTWFIQFRFLTRVFTRFERCIERKS